MFVMFLVVLLLVGAHVVRHLRLRALERIQQLARDLRDGGVSRQVEFNLPQPLCPHHLRGRFPQLHPQLVALVDHPSHA